MDAGLSSQKTIEEWVKEAVRQRQAIVDSGVTDFRHEWLISTPEMEAPFLAALKEAGFPVEEIHVVVPLRGVKVKGGKK